MGVSRCGVFFNRAGKVMKITVAVSGVLHVMVWTALKSKYACLNSTPATGYYSETWEPTQCVLRHLSMACLWPSATMRPMNPICK